MPAGSDVRFRALENHWIHVTAGRSVFKLAALAKDTFPALPEVPKPLAEVHAGVLAGLIDRTRVRHLESGIALHVEWRSLC